MKSLREQYETRFERALHPAEQRLLSLLSDHLKGVARIDRISVRAKSVDRFLKKAEKTNSDGSKKYVDPINQIQDQIGARVIVYYKGDVEAVSDQIEAYFRSIEEQEIIPDSAWEFGYFGKHYILLMPNEIRHAIKDAEDCLPEFFELQIKTLFQHAWSEAEHDLAYKPELGELDEVELRKLAFTAAQAWGADEIFEDLFQGRK